MEKVKEMLMRAVAQFACVVGRLKSQMQERAKIREDAKKAELQVKSAARSEYPRRRSARASYMRDAVKSFKAETILVDTNVFLDAVSYVPYHASSPAAYCYLLSPLEDLFKCFQGYYDTYYRGLYKEDFAGPIQAKCLGTYDAMRLVDAAEAFVLASGEGSVMSEVSLVIDHAHPGGMSHFKNLAACDAFFDAIRQNGIKICILTSQLNEISRMEMSKASQGYVIRKAKALIEDLQKAGLLSVADDVTHKENYADPEIIKYVTGAHGRTLVVTSDRDLRIRIRAAGGLCDSPIAILANGPYSNLNIKSFWKAD